jgi:diguanylate cyclase (GGDEF)-like protein
VTDRESILEAAFDVLDECVVLLDGLGRVVLWNQAAEELTGYRASEVLGHGCPAALYKVDAEHLARSEAACAARAAGPDDRHEFGGAVAGYAAGLMPVLVVGGHVVPAMLRRLGVADGVALLFYAVEEADHLPHGVSSAGSGVERSQAEMEDRLDEAHHLWVTNRIPFGVMWVTVDQSAALRRTHGREACDAMLRIVEQTLARGLKTGEILGRWGDDDYLVLSHERTAEMLVAHGQRLNGFVRTADFRWWGDRVNVTASIGASQAVEDETLHHMLTAAQKAAKTSAYAGGNRVSQARGQV